MSARSDWERTLDVLDELLDGYERALLDPDGLDSTMMAALLSFDPDSELPTLPTDLAPRLLALEVRNRSLIAATESGAAAIQPRQRHRPAETRTAVATFDRHG